MKWTAPILLLLVVLAQPWTVLAQTQDPPVAGPPSITLERFAQVLQAATSPAAPEAAAMYQAITATGIDPAFVLALFAEETQYGTAQFGIFPDPATTHNLANLSCAGHPSCTRGMRQYASWTEGAADLAQVIATSYVGNLGITTAREAAIQFKLGQAGSDAFADRIVALMASYQQAPPTVPAQPTTPTAPTPPPSGGHSIWTRDYWYEPIAQYAVLGLRTVAYLIWQLNKSGLLQVEEAIALQERMRTGFQPLLQLTGQHIIVGAGIVILGLMAWSIVQFLQVVLQTDEIDPRSALLLIVMLPLLPYLSMAFNGIDTTRSDLAATLYGEAFINTTQQAAPPQAAPGSGMGPLTPYFPGDATPSAITVAAAYLWATRDDVIRSDVFLPAAFDAQYYPDAQQEWTATAPAQRLERLELAVRGVWRMASGLLLVALAVVETSMDTLYTLLTGVLLLGLIGLTPFMIFQTFQDKWFALGHGLLSLFVSSVVISVVLGMLVGWLYSTAATGTPEQVFSTTLIALIVEAILVAALVLTLINAIMLMFGQVLGQTSTGLGGRAIRFVLSPMRRVGL